MRQLADGAECRRDMREIYRVTEQVGGTNSIALQALHSSMYEIAAVRLARAKD